MEGTTRPRSPLPRTALESRRAASFVALPRTGCARGDGRTGRLQPPHPRHRHPATTSPGEPLYFALRQGLYALARPRPARSPVSGLDYTRLREVRVDALHGDDRLDRRRSSFVGGAVRGSQRWIELPYFRFQPSELAKVLLSRLARRVRLRARRRRPADLRRTLAPARARSGARRRSSSFQPDLGTGARPGWRATLAVLFIAVVPWQHFAAIAAAECRARGRGARPAGPLIGVEVLQEAIRRNG